MSTWQWLLALHVTGGFLLLGATVTSAAFSVLALRSRRPSEIALFLGLTRRVLPLILAGSVLTLVLGLWLVHHLGLSYTRFWVVAAVVLLLAASFAGKKGGDREGATRELAERLAAAGDEPSAELQARVRDPIALAYSWGAGAAILAILALMVWKPGA